MTKKKKALSYEKQALKISKICSIVSYVALALPLCASLCIILHKLFNRHIYLSSLVGKIVVAGLIAGPILLLVSIASSVIIISQTRFLKGTKKKKKYTITAIMTIVVAAFLAFYLHVFMH